MAFASDRVLRDRDGRSLELTPAARRLCNSVALSDREIDHLEALQSARVSVDGGHDFVVEGEEFTVGVVDGRVLPPVSVRPPGGVFDTHAKYEDARSQFTPLDDSDPQSAPLREAAARVFAAVGVRRLGRADFIVPSGGRPVFLEVNTLPGMTERSLLPIAWEAAGGTFDSLVAAIVRGAMT